MIINDVHDKWELGCKNFDINKLDEIITTGLFKFVTWHQTREFQNKGKKLKFENIDYVCKTTKLTKEIQEHILKFILQEYVNEINEHDKMF